MLLLGKIMILQGVGHPISCLGVCYANDPKKGGYMTPAPALDLTTSLRGDFCFDNSSVTGARFPNSPPRGGKTTPPPPGKPFPPSPTPPPPSGGVDCRPVSPPSPAAGEEVYIVHCPCGCMPTADTRRPVQYEAHAPNMTRSSGTPNGVPISHRFPLHGRSEKLACR